MIIVLKMVSGLFLLKVIIVFFYFCSGVIKVEVNVVKLLE